VCFGDCVGEPATFLLNRNQPWEGLKNAAAAGFLPETNRTIADVVNNQD
jgi:hypothetical protein